jgi:serine/threonine protein kinase
MDNLTQSYSDLLEQRQGKGFSEPQVTEILKQVLSQLAQIHNQGGVHGAISLDSLIKDENSQQTLLISSPELTLPIRFPPEQLRTGQITATGDIYALGVTGTGSV